MIIALDLETTGLDKKKDNIIEIALIKFDENTFEIIDQFVTFVNPLIKIPDLNSNITGITDEMVENSPTIYELLSEIKEFIGDYPILGHNTYFDRDFLIEKGLNLQENIVIDTFFLANFISIGCKSMSLESLCSYYSIELIGAHRAFNDTKSTIFLFKKLLLEFEKFSIDKKNLIGYLFSRSLNKNIIFLSKILFNEGNKYSIDDFFSTLLSSFNYTPQQKFYEKSNGLLSVKEYISSLSNFEYRENQINISDSIYNNFNVGQKSIIEAPTGVGKTIAYLIPSILYSLKNKEKVFISTKTKILQDQLYNKDLETLKNSLPIDFSYTKIKGKSNYISINSFFSYITNFDIDYENLSFLSKIVLWLTKTTLGELDEINIINSEYKYLKHINADNNITLSIKNPYLKQEFLYRQKINLDNSNLVILNHSLLFTDLKNDFNFFGDIKNLIIDEAHSIEDIATESLKSKFNLKYIEESLDYINYILGILQINRSKFSEKKDYILSDISMFLNYFYNYIKIENKDDGYFQNSLVLPKFYESQDIDFTRLGEKICFDLDELKKIIKDIDFDFGKELRYIDSVIDIISKFLNKNNDKEFIKIITFNENDGLSIEYTILDIGNYLYMNFWSILKNCFLLSATITIFNNFDYINKSLKLNDFDFFRYESDFDYNKQATLYIPKDLGSIKNNFSLVSEFLKKLFIELKGNTLSLFTSLAIIRNVYVNLNSSLSLSGIKLLSQSIYGSKNKILETFLSNPNNSIILGTDSFWEGVDIPGNDLKYLIIHKMPFSVPTDPIFLARSKLFVDSFSEYAIPKSIMKLKQGFGRLIRTKTDIGTVFFLDDRIYSTSWGKAFMDAFPSDIKLKIENQDKILEEFKKINN